MNCNPAPHSESDLRYAERYRNEDVKVHRPRPQADDDSAAEAIAEGRRMYLGDLRYQTQPDDIEELLRENELAPAKTMHISIDPFTGRNPGYCFLEFEDKETADLAMSTLEGKELLGRPVKCRPCQPKGNVRCATSSGGNDDRPSASGFPSFSRWGDWKGREEGEDGQRGETSTDLAGKRGPDDAIRYLQSSNAVKEGRQLYVGGLPRMMDQAMNEEELRGIFNHFGVFVF